MRFPQFGVLVQHDVHLHPYAVPGVVRRDGLVPAYDGREAPGQEGDFPEQAVVDRGAAETGYVLQACFGPVVDDEEG